MAGFTNYMKLKPGDVFTVKGEHFRKLNELWYKSIENAALGEQMMSYEVDKLINQPDTDEPVKPSIDCSAKIVDGDGNRVTAPSARKLATEAQTFDAGGPPNVFKSKSEEKRVTTLRAARAAKKTAKPRKKAAKKQAKRKK